MIHFKQWRFLALIIFCVIAFVADVLAQKPTNGDSVSDKKNIMGHDDMSWKLENRSGIRFFINSYWGHYSEKSHTTFFNINGTQSSDQMTSLSDAYSANSLPSVNAGLTFSIKDGKWFTVDLGPSITFGSIKYEKRHSGSLIYSSSVKIFSFHTGINCNKPWYPYKVTMGILLDGSYLNYAGTFQQIDSNAIISGYYGNKLILHGFNFSYGLRVGGGYSLGKHFGINVDLDFIHSHYETKKQTGYYYNGTTRTGSFDYSRIIDLPPIGLGVGLNYYY